MMLQEVLGPPPLPLPRLLVCPETTVADDVKGVVTDDVRRDVTDAVTGGAGPAAAPASAPPAALPRDDRRCRSGVRGQHRGRRVREGVPGTVARPARKAGG